MGVNVTLLKQASFLSVIIGLGIGLFCLIPIVDSLIFVLYIMLFSVGLIVYLKKKNILGDISIKQGAIFGAVTGIASMVGICCTYVPITLIIKLLNNSYVNPIASMVKDSFLDPLYLFAGILMLVGILLLSGLMNCFGGGVIAYVYEVLKTLNEDNSNNNKFQL